MKNNHAAKYNYASQIKSPKSYNGGTYCMYCLLPLHDPFSNTVPNGQKQSKLPSVLTHRIRGSGQELTDKHSSVSVTKQLRGEMKSICKLRIVPRFTSASEPVRMKLKPIPAATLKSSYSISTVLCTRTSTL